MTTILIVEDNADLVYGLRNNLEIGLLVRGEAAEQVCILIERLYRERWLEDVSP